MIDESQTQAGDACAFAQHSNREFRKLPGLVDSRPWALLRRQKRMNIAARGMILRVRSRRDPRDVGMRALPCASRLQLYGRSSRALELVQRQIYTRSEPFLHELYHRHTYAPDLRHTTVWILVRCAVCELLSYVVTDQFAFLSRIASHRNRR
jgi:hypothetical protein